MERTYNLIQCGELFACTDNRERAIRLAKAEAKKNRLQVVIEERRITMLIRPDGYVIGGEE